MSETVRLTPFVDLTRGRWGWRGQSEPHPLRAVRHARDLDGLAHDMGERYGGMLMTPTLMTQVQTEVTWALASWTVP